MSFQFNEDISDRIKLKYDIQNTTDIIKQPVPGHESAIKIRIDRYFTCTSPVSCEACSDFVNNVCKRGKQKSP